MDPDPHPAARPLSRRATHAGTALLVLVTAAAAAPRVLLWWQDRSFWRDELALVQSLDTFTTGQLLGPLSDAQAAPPLWLLAVRATTAVLGTGERAYRLLPLASALAGLALLAVLAALFVRRRWVAAVPVAVASTTSEAVFYAAQAKPYTADVAVVTGLCVLAVLLVRAPPGGRRLRVFWYAALAAGVWVSYGAMLSAPLLAGWVLAVQLRRGVFGPGARGLARGVAPLLVPAASVLAAAAWAHHLTSRVPDFRAYWAGFLAPRTGDLGDLLAWHRFVGSDLLVREVGAPLWFATGLLVAAGFALLVRRYRAAAVVLVLPLVAAYVAGVTGTYPFGRRLVMFCVPGLLVCLAGAVDGMVDVAAAVVAGRARRLAVGAAAVLACAGVLTCAWTRPPRLVSDLTYLYGVDDYRGAFRYVGDRWQPGDLLVVGDGDRTAARVYGPRTGVPGAATRRAGPAADALPRRHCPLPAAVAGASRVWLLSDDVVPIYPGTVSRAALVAPMLDRFRLDHRRVKGLVTVQLLLPGAATDARPAARSDIDTARCLTYRPLGRARPGG